MKVIYELDDDLYRNAEAFFVNHFQQSGGYLPYVFQEKFPQHGNGFGSFLGGLIRRYVVPTAIRIAKTGGKQLLKSGVGFVGDLASGVNWREAGEDRLKEAAHELGKKFQDKFGGEQSGSGFQRLPVYRNSYGIRTGLNQLGGGRVGRRNKTYHSAVKLFSFVPPTAQRGQTTLVRRRRTRRRRSSTASPRRSRRRTRKSVQSSTSTTVRRRRTRRRKPAKRVRRVSRGLVTKRQSRKAPKRRRKQRGRGFPAIDWL
jgi:hypothetical protein